MRTEEVSIDHLNPPGTLKPTKTCPYCNGLVALQAHTNEVKTISWHCLRDERHHGTYRIPLDLTA